MTAMLRVEPHVVGSDLADLRGSVRLPGGTATTSSRYGGMGTAASLRRPGRQEARTPPSCSTQQTSCGLAACPEAPMVQDQLQKMVVVARLSTWIHLWTLESFA